MNSVRNKLNSLCESRAANLTDECRRNLYLSLRTFHEYLERLSNRYQELLTSERQLIVDLEDLERQNRTVNDLQLEFMDKTEAFHQQIYASLSAFISVVFRLLEKKDADQLPRESAVRFLRHVSDKSYDSVLKNQTHFLLQSVDFRSKFIDHPQQHALHDWMTYSSPYGTCIIYFIHGEQVASSKELQVNPYAPDFRPPVGHKSFYVSPAHKEVFHGMTHFVDRILDTFI